MCVGWLSLSTLPAATHSLLFHVLFHFSIIYIYVIAHTPRPACKILTSRFTTLRHELPGLEEDVPEAAPEVPDEC